MSTRSIPDPPDASWVDHLQSAFYPWFGRPEWWPADFGQVDSDTVADLGDDR